MVQGGGDDVVVGNRENALCDAKVAIEELEAIKMHAGSRSSHLPSRAPATMSGQRHNCSLTQLGKGLVENEVASSHVVADWQKTLDPRRGK